MTEFENWAKENDWKDYVNSVEDDGLLNELQEDAAKKGWKAALQWIKRELHAARNGFEPDLGLHNLLRRELGEEYKETEK